MKKITLLVAALFLAFAANAQLVEIVEDFESGAFPAGWSSLVNTGSCDVMFGSAVPTGDPLPSSGVFFDDDACGSGADASNVTILSDVYDLSGSDGLITIGYDVGFEVAGIQSFIVEVNAGDGWELIAEYNEDLGAIITESFDGEATNDDFQVRWTYDDNGGEWGWHGAIDNFNLTYTNVLGVSNDTVEGFSFAPNPAQDYVTLTASNTIGRVSLINILGQTVIETEINATSSDLNISSLAAGTYILKVAVGDETGTYHIIKE